MASEFRRSGTRRPGAVIFQSIRSRRGARGKTLLDESVVFFGSELAHPPTHEKTNMPFLLAGGGGELRGGRHLNFGGRSHNDLLVTILNLFGDNRETYGEPEFCTGALSGLT
jgi:hypothetical protein